jgi:hypothetical protein
MERTRNYALNSKRVFGKDITNLERRNKNNSISEKINLAAEGRNKSRSLDKKTLLEPRDPLATYEVDIVSYMLEIQVTADLFRKRRAGN